MWCASHLHTWSAQPLSCLRGPAALPQAPIIICEYNHIRSSLCLNLFLTARPDYRAINIKYKKIYFSNIAFSDQRVLDHQAEHQSPFDTAWLAKIMDMSPSIGYALDDLFADATGIRFEVLEMHLYGYPSCQNPPSCQPCWAEQ